MIAPRSQDLIGEPPQGLRVGVITDTHVGDELAALPREALELLAGSDLILHAGDICDPAVLAQLEELAPVLAVRGNHDPADVDLPEQVVVEVGGARIGMTHGVRAAAIEHLSAAAFIAAGRLDVEGHCRALVRRFPPVDCLVFGHLHIPVRRTVGATLCFSPGALYQPEADPGFDWSTRSRRIYRAVRGRLPDGYRRPAVGFLEIAPGRLGAHAVALRRPLA